MPSLIKSYLSQVNRSDWERHPWASQVISLMWSQYDRQVETFEGRKGILQDLVWQEEQERVGTERPRSSSGVPAPGATVYGRKDGIEMLAKAWHSKTLACSFQLMKSGRVKLSIWQPNQRFWHDHRQRMKCLRALLCESEIGVGAHSRAPACPGVNEITCALATPEEEEQMSPVERAKHEEEKGQIYTV